VRSLCRLSVPFGQKKALSDVEVWRGSVGRRLACRVIRKTEEVIY
jgi:hypothetical protein